MPKGAFVSLLGPSGAGKTTLLKLLAGLLKPTRGEVEAFGHVLGKAQPQALRAQIGYIPQQLGLVRSTTALENVLLGSLVRHPGPMTLLGLFPKQERERALDLLDFVGLADKADEKVYRLSGGQRQRVAIARTLLQQPKLVLADELVSDLDLPLATELLEMVRDIANREGITYITAMHEIQLVQRLSDEVVVLKGGAIVHRGEASAMSLPALTDLLR